MVSEDLLSGCRLLVVSSHGRKKERELSGSGRGALIPFMRAPPWWPIRPKGPHLLTPSLWGVKISTYESAGRGAGGKGAQICSLLQWSLLILMTIVVISQNENRKWGFKTALGTRSPKPFPACPSYIPVLVGRPQRLPFRPRPIPLKYNSYCRSECSITTTLVLEGNWFIQHNVHLGTIIFPLGWMPRGTLIYM